MIYGSLSRQSIRREKLCGEFMVVESRKNISFMAAKKFIRARTFNFEVLREKQAQ